MMSGFYKTVLMRSLASGVRRSAEEITDTIGNVRAKILSAVASVEETRDKTRHGVDDAALLDQRLNEIYDYMVITFDSVTMIAASMEQQSQVSMDIARNLESISSSVDKTTSAAVESANIASHLALLTQQKV